MLDARRAYVDAVRWTKAGGSNAIDSGRFAARALGWSFCSGVVVLGTIGLLAPASLGAAPSSRGLSSGGWTLALAVLVLAGSGLLATRYATARWLAARIREPLLRPLEDDPNFEGAAAALAECPAPLKARYGISWVLLPAFGAVAGTTFAFSAAYFLVSAIVSQLDVNWNHPLLGGINALLALLTFRLAVTRLRTWRLATSVHADATGRYIS